MINEPTKNVGVVDAYLSSLLMDSSIGRPEEAEHTDNFRFARVDKKHQLITLWQRPANRQQAICMDLTLLSCVQKLPSSNLRTAMLNSIQVIGCY